MDSLIEPAPGHFTRLLQPWRIAHADAAFGTVWLHRVVYDRDRAPLRQRLRARIDFPAAGPGRPARRALVGCVRLGKISPGFAQAIVDARGASDSAAGGCPSTLAGLLLACGRHVLDAFRDPLEGVMTGPFHAGLFGAGSDFIEVMDRLAALDEARGLDSLGQYVELYLRCRRLMVVLALDMARELPPGTVSAWQPSAGDFFAWWRCQWTRSIEVRLAPGGRGVRLPMPAGLSDARSGVVGRAVAAIAARHAALALALGHGPGVTAAFVRLYAEELLDGLSGLLLNRRDDGACPFNGPITMAFAGAGGRPTRSDLVKEVSMGRHRLDDVFGRFFAVQRRRVRLAEGGPDHAVELFGTCPFPDHGLLRAASPGGD